MCVWNEDWDNVDQAERAGIKARQVGMTLTQSITVIDAETGAVSPMMVRPLARLVFAATPS